MAQGGWLKLQPTFVPPHTHLFLAAGRAQRWPHLPRHVDPLASPKLSQPAIPSLHRRSAPSASRTSPQQHAPHHLACFAQCPEIFRAGRHLVLHADGLLEPRMPPPCTHSPCRAGPVRTSRPPGCCHLWLAVLACASAPCWAGCGSVAAPAAVVEFTHCV